VYATAVFPASLLDPGTDLVNNLWIRGPSDLSSLRHPSPFYMFAGSLSEMGSNQWFPVVSRICTVPHEIYPSNGGICADDPHVSTSSFLEKILSWQS